MTRVSATKSAGLDLLDRLYRNQILVHLIFPKTDQEWLHKIANAVHLAVEERGFAGYQGERLKHWTLCLLEILLADDFRDITKHLPIIAPPLPEDLTTDIYEKINELNTTFICAVTSVASQKTGMPEDSHLALEIAHALVHRIRPAPSHVRYRLAERVLAMEFSNAPINLFSWLAHRKYVPSAKYSAKPKNVIDKAGVIRALSIIEFETLRSYIAGAIGHKNVVPKTLLEHFDKRLSNVAKERLLSAMQAEERRRILPSLKNRFLGLLHHRWEEPAYMSGFLANCSLMAPYTRFALHKQSTALTDIGAAMIALRKVQGATNALYAEEGMEKTIAYEVSEELSSRGFEVHPRTIYRRIDTGLKNHARGVEGYFYLLKEFGIALPAQHEDMAYYHQLGFSVEP